MNRQQVAADIVRWAAEQDPPRGRLLKKKDIMSYTGLSRTHVDKITNGLPKVGGSATYFYLDIADRLIAPLNRRVI